MCGECAKTRIKINTRRMMKIKKEKGKNKNDFKDSQSL